MKKRNWWNDILLMAVLIALAISIVCLGTQLIWNGSKAQTLIDRASNKFPLYEVTQKEFKFNETPESKEESEIIIQSVFHMS